MESTEGVQAVHDLHVWSVTSRFPALSAHVVADRGLSLAEVEQVLARLRRRLRERYGLRHVTLQVEPPAGGAGAVRPSGPADCLPCEPVETTGTNAS
jgi:cobalt-zinc-cadmium efflux system protein